MLLVLPRLPTFRALLPHSSPLCPQSPFKLLGSNGPLNGSQVSVDNLSPSDKVVTCKGKLTYVDLDVQQMFDPPIQGPQFTLERCANPLAHNSMQFVPQRRKTLAGRDWSARALNPNPLSRKPLSNRLQQWNYNTSWKGGPGTGEIYLRDPPGYYFTPPQYIGTCMDIHARSTDNNATVYSCSFPARKTAR